jgi:hypothetical protein
MHDLDDLGSAHMRPESLRFNAVTGVLAKYVFDANEWRRVPVEIGPGSRWAVDMLTRRRGLGRVTDSSYDVRMSYVGEPVPEAPNDYKPAVSMMLYSPEHGLCYMETCSTILVRCISGLWEHYRSYRQSSEGLIPVIEIGEPRQIQIGSRNNPRMFYAPSFRIIDWIERDTVPAFKATAPTVALPSPANMQIEFRSALKLPKPKRGAQPVSDDLNDGIPF